MNEEIINVITVIFLSILSYQDIRTKTFSLRILAAFGVVASLVVVLRINDGMALYLAGAVIGLFLLILSLITKGKIGIGDALMFMITGALLGINANVSLLYLTCLLSGLFALILLITKKKNRQERIPLAPFTLASFLVLMIAG